MILPIANKPGYYLVPSTSGGPLHEVNGHTGSCDCEAYRRCRPGTDDLCAHSRALREYLDRQQACPACSGRGQFVTQFRFESGSGPIPCMTCDGSGRRDTADPYLVASADRFRAAQREQELSR